MPTTVQAYPSSTIIEALRVRIRTVTGVDDQYVRIVFSDQYEYSKEETLIAIRPLGPLPYTDAGAGRRARPTTRMVRIYLHKRSSLDFVGDDRIVASTLLDLEDEVFNALDDHILVDALGTPLIIEPIHPTDSSGGPPVRKPVEDIGDVFSRLDFEIKYLLVNETPIP